MLFETEHAFHDAVVALVRDVLAVVFEPTFVALADDEDDVQMLGILAIAAYRGLHGFGTVENGLHVKLRVGDAVVHVRADLLHRLVVGVFESKHEMVDAVLRGVDVSVILPGENNHRLVDWAMRHQMPMLADRGVKIYRQPPPFAHTKLLLIDGEYTLLGSANLDPRSLNLNFELVMEVLDLRLAEQLSAFYDEVRSRSVSVPTTYPALPYRLRNAASWIFSPYL